MDLRRARPCVGTGRGWDRRLAQEENGFHEEGGEDTRDQGQVGRYGLGSGVSVRKEADGSKRQTFYTQTCLFLFFVSFCLLPSSTLESLVSTPLWYLLLSMTTHININMRDTRRWYEKELTTGKRREDTQKHTPLLLFYRLFSFLLPP